MTVYYQDDTVTLHLGDMREVLPDLDLQADLICTDPPYGETSLAWDRWPDAWPTLAACHARSMWCFGSMRMFLDRRDDFTDAGWKISQDVVWEKNAGTGFASDRFKRVHEHALHWYLGEWRDIHHEAIREPYYGPHEGRVSKGNGSPGEHLGEINANPWQDDGTRMTTSVIKAKNLRGLALHPTQKPAAILDPLIRYACPRGGVVLDLFAGSGSTLDAARQCGRRAVGVEADERYCEAAARRLSQLTFGEAS